MPLRITGISIAPEMRSRILNIFIQSFNDTLLNTCYMPGAMLVRDRGMLKSEVLTSGKWRISRSFVFFQCSV